MSASATNFRKLPEARPLPAALESEKAILCTILNKPEILLECRLSPEDFHHPSHKTIYRALHQLRDDGTKIDLVTFTQLLADWNLLEQTGGPSVPADIFTMEGVLVSSWREYEKNVQEKATLRKSIKVLEDGLTRCYDSQYEEPGEILSDVTGGLQKIEDKQEDKSIFTDLFSYLAGDVQQEVPSVAETFDGKHLFYAGRLNEIHAEPASGKTNVLIAASIAVLNEGGTVLYIDPEDTPGGIVTRFLLLGASPDAIRDHLKYLHNPGPQEIRSAQAWAKKYKPVLVILDGVAESMAAVGADENAASDVLLFFRDNLRPFAETGAAVVIADHVTKSTEGRGQFARGSGAKAGRYDGVSFEIVAGKEYTPSQAGFVKLKVAKDRNGGVGPRGFTAAELHFMPGINGRTVIAFREPAGKNEEPFRPTAIMGKIEQYLAAHRQATKRELRSCGKAEWVDLAVILLTEEKVITSRKEGCSIIYSLLNKEAK